MYLSPLLHSEPRNRRKEVDSSGQTASLCQVHHHVDGFQLQKCIRTFLKALQKFGGCKAQWSGYGLESNASFRLPVHRVVVNIKRGNLCKLEQCVWPSKCLLWPLLLALPLFLLLASSSLPSQEALGPSPVAFHLFQGMRAQASVFISKALQV